MVDGRRVRVGTGCSPGSLEEADVAAETEELAAQVAKMPADGSPSRRRPTGWSRPAQRSGWRKPRPTSSIVSPLTCASSPTSSTSSRNAPRAAPSARSEARRALRKRNGLMTVLPPNVLVVGGTWVSIGPRTFSGVPLLAGLLRSPVTLSQVRSGRRVDVAGIVCRAQVSFHDLGRRVARQGRRRSRTNAGA